MTTAEAVVVTSGACHPEVELALRELHLDFAGSCVTHEPDGQGGAFVLVDPVDLGPKFEPRHTWVRFNITFQYPAVDVYPHFIRPDIRRVDRPMPADGTPLGQGSASVAFAHGSATGPAVQLSRRSNHLDPLIDTAALKLHKVLAWLVTS